MFKKGFHLSASVSCLIYVQVFTCVFAHGVVLSCLRIWSILSDSSLQNPPFIWIPGMTCFKLLLCSEEWKSLVYWSSWHLPTQRKELIIVWAFNIPHSCQAILSTGVTLFIRGVKVCLSYGQMEAAGIVMQCGTLIKDADILQVLTPLSGFPNNNLLSSQCPVTVRNNDAMLKIDIRGDIWNLEHQCFSVTDVWKYKQTNAKLEYKLFGKKMTKQV